MIRKLTLVVLAFAAPLAEGCGSDDLLAPSQASHIEQNVPVEADFDRLLRRDLSAYFGGAVVEYDLLRDGPTQSGVAYPKYYAWVRVLDDGRLADEGAIKIAAIDGVRFEVTDYLPRAAIQSDPDSAGAIFPSALLPAIQSRAGA